MGPVISLKITPAELSSTSKRPRKEHGIAFESLSAIFFADVSLEEFVIPRVAAKNSGKRKRDEKGKEI